MKTAPFAPVLVVLTVALAACGSPVERSGDDDERSAASAARVGFDAVPAGALPPGWTAAATGDGVAARWAVVADPSAPSAPGVLALTGFPDGPNRTYNVCYDPGLRFRDGRIAVRVLAESGEIDQGGGPIWRVRGPDDYLICRANPLESNFRLYTVVDGERRQIASVDVPVEAGVWHLIEVEQDGERIVCTLNGGARLEAETPLLAGEGGVGVWTKADAVTRFDDLAITPRSR